MAPSRVGPKNHGQSAENDRIVANGAMAAANIQCLRVNIS
jgi:hypothetical protein